MSHSKRYRYRVRMTLFTVTCNLDKLIFLLILCNVSSLFGAAMYDSILLFLLNLAAPHALRADIPSRHFAPSEH